jgi:hypothetical protein
MRKRPCPEMMHEAIPATTQCEPRLAGLVAQDVGIEQAQIGPRLQFDADLGQHLAFEQEAKPAQPIHRHPLSLVVTVRHRPAYGTIATT